IVFGIIILSMWTNLLTRTYAWMVLLQRTGVINRTLMDIGLISQPLPLINNLTGVTIGMVYIMLPFMILPLS
ncbi:MAG: ABC transporter permease, partial [Mesorhizobium sp.]